MESARAILQAFANRAYRQPATKDEVDRLAALVQKARKDGASSIKAIQIAMMGVLVSPSNSRRILKKKPVLGCFSQRIARNLCEKNA